SLHESRASEGRCSQTRGHSLSWTSTLVVIVLQKGRFHGCLGYRLRGRRGKYFARRRFEREKPRWQDSRGNRETARWQVALRIDRRDLFPCHSRATAQTRGNRREILPK